MHKVFTSLMQLSETQRRHLSDAGRTSLAMDLINTQDGAAENSTTAVGPGTDVCSSEPTLSLVDPATPTGTSNHDAPPTPRHGASSFTDETKPTHSRSNSWSSFSHELLYDFPISVGMAATMQEASEEPTATTKARRSSLLLSRPGATLDMAFFLKNTDPPSSGKVHSKDKVNLKRMGLGIFKKRRSDDGSCQKAVYNSPPHDRAEPKVTLQGTRYLQIVPHPTPFKIEGLNLSKSPCLPAPASPHQLSVPLHLETYGTETIEDWISTFTTQHQEDDFDFPISKGISIMYHTPTDCRSHDSHLVPLEARPWLSGDDAFTMTMENDYKKDKDCIGALQPCSGLNGIPPSSPKRHKSLASTHTREINNRGFTSCKNNSSEHLFGVTSCSPKESRDLRAADILIDQGLRTLAASSQGVKEFKALPELPNGESADNSNLITSSMIQVWRQRDAAATAPKAKYIPRSRRITMLKHSQDSQDSNISGTEDHTDDQIGHTSPSTARSSQIRTSLGSTPTTTRGSLALSQVMLVAEQMPIPRGRHVNKPAPLLLRGRAGGKPKAIAVRTGDLDAMSMNESASAPVATEMLHVLSITNKDASKRSTADVPFLLQPIKFNKPQRPAPRAPSPQPAMVPVSGHTAPGVPPRSLARLGSPTRPMKQPAQDSSASTSSASSQGISINFPKRSSSLISTTQAPYTQSQARTQAPPHHANTRTLPPPRNTSSRTSNHSTDKLTARISALERENRLLEAALMAVLKTGGTLNKCPCGFLSSPSRSTKQSSLSAPETKTRSSSRPRRTKTPQPQPQPHHPSQEAMSDAPRSSDTSDKDDGYLSVTALDGSRNGSFVHRRASVQSFESMESGFSALEVYLGTRV